MTKDSLESKSCFCSDVAKQWDDNGAKEMQRKKVKKIQKWEYNAEENLQHFKWTDQTFELI